MIHMCLWFLVHVQRVWGLSYTYFTCSWLFLCIFHMHVAFPVHVSHVCGFSCSYSTCLWLSCACFTCLWLSPTCSTCLWLVVYMFHMFVAFSYTFQTFVASRVQVSHVCGFSCSHSTSLWLSFYKFHEFVFFYMFRMFEGFLVNILHMFVAFCTFSARLEDFWYSFYTCLLIFVHFPHVRGLSCEIYLFVHVSHVYGFLVHVLHVQVYILLMERAFVFVDCSERFRLSSFR